MSDLTLKHMHKRLNDLLMYDKRTMICVFGDLCSVSGDFFPPTIDKETFDAKIDSLIETVRVKRKTDLLARIEDLQKELEEYDDE